MANVIQFKRGPAGTRIANGGTPANGEPFWTDDFKLYVGDGATPGGKLIGPGEASPASSVTFTPHDTIAATDVQAALEELSHEKAPLDAPALTGVPTAPTAAVATNTTQLATTAFVKAEFSPVGDGVSGADKVGVTAITGITGATVQACLETLDTRVVDGGTWSA